MNKIAILGEAYCGSTVLSLMLGAHPLVFNAGECEEITRGTDRPLCSLCRVRELVCPVWTRQWRNELAQSPHPHDDILAKTQAQVLVDSSKYVFWFDKYVPQNAADWLIVHLVKDPEEQIASYKMRGNEERRDIPQAIRFSSGQYRQNRQWRIAMRALGATTMQLRYKTLATEPAISLQKFLAPVGLSFFLPQLDYWEFEQHCIGGNTYPYSNYRGLEERASYIPGEEYNRNRYRERRRSIFYDDKWKEVLTAEELATIRNHPAIVDMRAMLAEDE
ncbi:MAG TPA: hypothetical protein PKW95_20610 [bacterium]|nr:hypothetical protein [bacterium]